MKKKVGISADLRPLFGNKDQNVVILEKHLNITLTEHDNGVQVSGPPKGVKRAVQILLDYDKLAATGTNLDEYDFASILSVVTTDPTSSLFSLAAPDKKKPKGGTRRIAPKNVAQREYMDAIDGYDMTFGIGPAGTGKTYLAMAMAVTAFLDKKVEKLILVRPAVEAGEKLGFLPGTLQEKVDPYLRPLYDALHDMVSPEKVKSMMEKGVVEVAPIAFMRGRTLKNAFIIMDEAQNTSVEQMKMFLTRLGEGSKVVINGDTSQVDLPSHIRSGLLDALRVLKGVEGIHVHEFTDADVVRHALVQRIVTAYEKSKEK